MDPLAITMKAVTFAGVVLAATWLNLPADATRSLLARLAMGVAGVVIMLANVWLAVTPLALIVDFTYAGSCAYLLVKALRSRAVTFDVLGEAA